MVENLEKRRYFATSSKNEFEAFEITDALTLNFYLKEVNYLPTISGTYLLCW